MKRRAGALMGLLGAATVLGVASVAWACTTFSMINLSAAAGPASSEVTVKGTSASANGPVTLRWDSRTSAPVAQATADAEGSFSVPVRVPDTGQGVHFLVAIDAKGDVARGAFEVTSGSPVEPASAFNSRPAATASDPNQWLRTGVIGLGLGLMVMVPLAGLAVLAKPRARVRATSSEG